MAHKTDNADNTDTLLWNWRFGFADSV